ncbi:hypothetical protein FIBSPDRAFT_964105 [Athelia psychrophila]|uniref:Uncharacterized protein n=1 Tax=Athelia psychrophila TaxID=1759441 RepID=A0A165Y705_9AGAM|nr:hypothetical protein FIBSPDRAFT_964105 [Fibularhizoctonia sp. CBS 109695]
MTAYCSDIDTCRTLRQIIQPAVSALIASTYLSVHQNINRRGLPWYSEAVNTVIIIIVALLVPEWIFMWALRSYIIARRTQRELEQARSEAKSEWGNPGFVGNLPLAWQRGYGIGVVDRNEKYTIAHAFFVNMGGLLMYDLDGNSYGPLDMGTTIRLIRGGHLLLPRLERLQGVSKTTTFGQSFAAAQLFSFLLDCSVRICQGLPLADFEIMAYAHAWIAVASFGFWWVKPQNVSCAEVVSIEVVAMANDPDSASEPPANIGRIRGFYRTFPVWQVVYAAQYCHQTDETYTALARTPPSKATSDFCPGFSIYTALATTAPSNATLDFCLDFSIHTALATTDPSNATTLPNLSPLWTRSMAAFFITRETHGHAEVHNVHGTSVIHNYYGPVHYHSCGCTHVCPPHPVDTGLRASDGRADAPSNPDIATTTPLRKTRRIIAIAKIVFVYLIRTRNITIAKFVFVYLIRTRNITIAKLVFACLIRALSSL